MRAICSFIFHWLRGSDLYKKRTRKQFFLFGVCWGILRHLKRVFGADWLTNGRQLHKLNDSLW